MKDCMQLILNIDTLQKNGNIWDAEIYFVNSNGFFPCLKWIDMPFLVLSEWLHTLCNFAMSNGKTDEIRFFEGSFHIELVKINKQEIETRFYENDKLAYSLSNVIFMDFIKVVFDGCQKLIDAFTCEHKEIDKNDTVSIARLKDGMKRVEYLLNI